MKLIYHITLIFWFTVKIDSQKFPHEQFPFPPQFKQPNSGVFGSDSSIYLPPESHTSIPYFSINNGNKLPYQFLPPTATKVPSVYPTPFPMVMSSTIMSRRDDEDDDEDEEISRVRVPQVTPPNVHIKNNQTNKNNDHMQDREMRSVPKTFNFQHPIDRIDIKYPPQFHTVTSKTPINQSPPSQRRMIISSEILKNEQGPDQVKRASLLGPQLISSPVVYYSTTEPAIPILRLSNEMDLDGSFSYEALGADQTHYVQHSRMENSGTDKEEQIVEGSYSYVGDNGQTYTVHYVADSNGYRASGDHLPVPPPIPEIIQRAVQYNLAEEAKKPLNLKSWQDNEKEFEHSESDKHRFSVSPPRNLFTGRTPEAFSFGLSQSILQNNLAAADNSQVPVKTNFDFSADQSKGKINNGPIAPQITFLASQGAHNPSINNGQQQISRVLNNEKPTLPQIMNYEAASSESDQDSNKGLWRWQYGLNANTANESPNKNSISRSFGEGDDVIINFNNMSPEQYTNLMKSDFLEPHTEIPINQKEFDKKEYINAMQEQNVNYSRNEDVNPSATKQNENVQYDKQYNGINNPSYSNEQIVHISTENALPYTFSTVSSLNEQYQTNEKASYSNYPYTTPTPLATQTYGYSDIPYESVKPKNIRVYITTDSTEIFNENHDGNIEQKYTYTTNSFKNNITKLHSDSKASTNDGMIDNVKNIKFTDFIQAEEKSNFKPIVKINLEKQGIEETTTTESSLESIIRENYFLKNLLKPENDNPKIKSENIETPHQHVPNKINIEQKYDKLPSYENDMPKIKSENIESPHEMSQVPDKMNIEQKYDKLPKYIQYHTKPQNEIKNIVNKPLDMTDVLNYITFKNHFESSKLKTKNKFSNSDNFSQRIEKPQIFIPLEHERDEGEEPLVQDETRNNLRTLNNHKQQGLRGIIKNYKILQRNSNTKNVAQNNDQFMTDSLLRHLKTMQTQNLPPLGRAGPSMKSYLPPTYL